MNQRISMKLMLGISALGLVLAFSMALDDADLVVFQAGDTISSEQMNNNFTLLEAQIAEIRALSVVTAPSGDTYSLNAVYRGASALETNGNIGGYGAAKEACEEALNSPTAHMCTLEEVGRSAQLGMMPTSGPGLWIASMSKGAYWDQARTNYLKLADCAGWTATETAGANSWQWGMYWHPGAARVDDTDCTITHKIACCDR